MSEDKENFTLENFLNNRSNNDLNNSKSKKRI